MTENVFFTSDTHFNHKKIKDFCPTTRHGSDLLEHDEILIRNWNNVVRRGDRVYHLGDFSWGNSEYTSKVISRLSGQIHLIYGNHDEVIRGNSKLRSMFTSVSDYKEIELDNIKVVLFHFPIHEWHKIHRGAFHFHGHCHGSVTLPGRGLDVGIDGQLAGDGRMTPYSWLECKEYCLKRPALQHHNMKGVGDL